LTAEMLRLSLLFVLLTLLLQLCVVFGAENFHAYDYDAYPICGTNRSTVERVNLQNGIHPHRLPCDTRCYDMWKAETYTGKLAIRPSFWRYPSNTADFFPLVKGLALELATSKCERQFDNLRVFTAGRMGPVDQQMAFKVMVSDLCCESDVLHNEAIQYTGCNCMDIDTRSDEGGWCRHNSARLQCSILGYCPTWECTIEDFMCPRYEYNRMNIPFKGRGSCIDAAPPSVLKSSFLAALTLTCMATISMVFM